MDSNRQISSTFSERSARWVLGWWSIATCVHRQLVAQTEGDCCFFLTMQWMGRSGLKLRVGLYDKRSVEEAGGKWVLNQDVVLRPGRDGASWTAWSRQTRAYVEVPTDALILAQAFGTEGATREQVFEACELEFEDDAERDAVFGALESAGLISLADVACGGTEARGADEAQPIFVVGCPRSGTTLFRKLLNSHPRIACAPESKFLLPLQELRRAEFFRKGLRSLGFVDEEVDSALRNFAEGFLSAWAIRNHKPRWADKSPDYIYCLDFLRNLFANNMSMLLVVRHPFDVVESIEEALDAGNSNFIHTSTLPFVEQENWRRLALCRYWVDANRRLLQFGQRFEDATHFVRYDNLVRNPLATMNGVFEFLGENACDDLLDVAFSMEHGVGIEDVKSRRTTAVHADSMDKWRTWPQQERDMLWETVGDVAGALGFGCDETVMAKAS